MESPHHKKKLNCPSDLKCVIWFFISRKALEFNVSSSPSKSFPSASIREVTKASSGRKAARTHVLSIKRHLENDFRFSPSLSRACLKKFRNIYVPACSGEENAGAGELNCWRIIFFSFNKHPRYIFLRSLFFIISLVFLCRWDTSPVQ